MSNYGDTPDETPQDPNGQPPQTPQDPYGQPPQTPPAAPNYGQPPAGQPPYGQAPAGQPPYGQAPAAGAFSIGDAFSYGWKKFQANLGPLIIAALVLFAVIAVIQIIQAVLTGGAELEFNPNTGEFEGGSSFGASLIRSLFFSLLTNLALVAIQAAIVKGALDITKGKELALGAMFEGINWLQVLIAALIIAVASAIGFVACVLPMFVVMFLTSFTTYFIVDKNLPAIEAIQASIKFTIANAGTLILFFLATLAAYFVGALLCGVGLLVAIPVVVIATAYTYRTLNGEQVAA